MIAGAETTEVAQQISMVIAHAMPTHVMAGAIAMPTNIVSVRAASHPRLDHVRIMFGLHVPANRRSLAVDGGESH